MSTQKTLSVNRAMIYALLLFGLNSCGGGGSEESGPINNPPLVDIQQPNTLMGQTLAMIGQTAAQIVNGLFPASSSNPAAPKAQADTGSLTVPARSSTRTLANVQVTVKGNTAIAKILAQFAGAASYYSVAFASPAVPKSLRMSRSQPAMPRLWRWPCSLKHF